MDQDDDQNELIGIISTIVSIVAFGSAYVPVKEFEHRDGIFVSWLMSIGQVLPCFLCSLLHGTTTVYPIAMIGGMFYAAGNTFSVYVMDGLGMAVGILLWNVFTTLWGWAIKRFGLFGLEADAPEHTIINMIGVLVICTGGSLLSLVKSEPIEPRPSPYHEEVVKKEESPTPKRKMLSLLAVVVVGTLFGNIMTPLNFIIDKDIYGPDTPQNPAAYMLSYSLGAVITSTFIFCGYAGYKRNDPFVNPELVLPTIISGTIYGVAMSTFFVSTNHLDQIISYPLICMTPGMITSLYSIFLFHEIQGRTNLIKFVVAFCVALTGVTLISISKIPF